MNTFLTLPNGLQPDRDKTNTGVTKGAYNENIEPLRFWN